MAMGTFLSSYFSYTTPTLSTLPGFPYFTKVAFSPRAATFTHQTFYLVTPFSRLLTQIQQLMVDTTCSSSNRASGWRRKVIWVTLMTWMYHGCRCQMGWSVSETADLLLIVHIVLQGSQRLKNRKYLASSGSLGKNTCWRQRSEENSCGGLRWQKGSSNWNGLSLQPM